MSPTPLALPAALPCELLTWILTHTSHPTTLLICKPRAEFLECLLASVTSTSIMPTPARSNADIEEIPSSPPEPIATAAPPPAHSLLTKTLHQIAVSRHISLIYIPTVSHLRGYLSILPQPAKIAAPPEVQWEKKGSRKARLVVYGLVELHRDTSEWSAQGLGRSLAALVEAGRRDGRGVVCLEEASRDMGISGEESIGEMADGNVDEEVEVEERRVGWKGWNEGVPMLNGSVRRAGLGGEDAGWGGRTVDVGRIFARWFRFGKAEW